MPRILVSVWAMFVCQNLCVCIGKVVDGNNHKVINVNMYEVSITNPLFS
jgi:hypothetical protein